MAEDFDLIQTGSLYALADPTEDLIRRMRNRFTVQFLSSQKGARGSIFVSELSAARVKSNADVVNLFTLTSAHIITNMRRLAQDIVPIRTVLNSFTFLSATAILLNFDIVTELGTVEETLTVEAAT